MEGSSSHGPQVPKKDAKSQPPVTTKEKLNDLCRGLMKIHSQDKNFDRKSINMVLDLLSRAMPHDTALPKSFEEVKKIAEEEQLEQMKVGLEKLEDEKQNQGQGSRRRIRTRSGSKGAELNR